MTKIHVICGGASSEREVSLRSGAAIAKALEEAGYEIAILDTTATDTEMANCDVAFPVLHGVGGEDGEIQARLRRLGVTFVGSDVEASQLCMDKTVYRKLMLTENLLMPEGATVTAFEYEAHELAVQPHVLKPVDGGSSIDTHIVRDVASADRSAIADSFQRHTAMILEELIEGVELTVGILGDTALPVIEIIPPTDAEFDYDNKYNGKTQELCPPEHVSDDVQKAVQLIALQAHTLAGCRDFSRTDFITTPAGKQYLLETNTIPGLTKTSLFPKMTETAGMTMPELVDTLVKMALKRH